MADQNYERIIEKIEKISNLDKSEIERRVEAKRARLSGLISKDGAAQVVAAELGISFDKERLKILNQISPLKNMRYLLSVLVIGCLPRARSMIESRLIPSAT